MATRTRKRIIDNAMTELRSMCVFASSGEDEESALCLLAISKTLAVAAMFPLLLLLWYLAEMVDI
jgi:hypothetical protein